MPKTLALISLPLLMLLMTSCEGVFDGIYDTPVPEKPDTHIDGNTVEGTLYIDANKWDEWHYIDLPTLNSHVMKDASYDLNQDWRTYSIPMPEEGTPSETVTGHQRPGQYMYWFDGTIGQTVKGHEFRYFTPAPEQPAPTLWSFAVHRSEVRTNGGSAWESSLTDISKATLATCRNAVFIPDEWSETDVWDDSRQMLLQLIPSQGIRINKVLGRWLNLGVMPDYVIDSHVFFLRFPDETVAALQLVNHLSDTNKRCCLTIKYRYPLQ